MTILSKYFLLGSKDGKYLVKWIGWASEDNTWEPEAHLECTGT